MSDLKPCSFCGGTEIKMYSLGSSDLHGFSHLCKINGEVMVKVESRFFNTEEEAAEAWNRRAVNVPDTNVGDTISRQAALDAFWKLDIELRPSAIDAITDMLRTLPSAQPVAKDTNVPSTDCISRQAAIEALGEKPLAWTEGDYELGLQNQWQSDVDALKALPAAQPERTCVNCGRTVNNGGWYADGGTRCPIEEHYALPKDGYCHLWEKRNITDDDYPERREE